VAAADAASKKAASGIPSLTDQETFTPEQQAAQDWSRSVEDPWGYKSAFGPSPSTTLTPEESWNVQSGDPWAPAQDCLKRQIGTGSQLAQQFQARPFSQAQQTAYGNVGGLLDLLNTNAGGLLSGPQANASGANQFVRGQPTRLQGSTFAPTAAQWTPGLLGNFGTKG
jgi:hypothetical protein